MSRVTFQRRHYEAIADIIAKAKHRPNDTPAECLADLEQDFADLFAADNGNFRPGQFHQACDRGSQDRQRKDGDHAHHIASVIGQCAATLRRATR